MKDGRTRYNFNQPRPRENVQKYIVLSRCQEFYAEAGILLGKHYVILYLVSLLVLGFKRRTSYFTCIGKRNLKPDKMTICVR